MRRTLERAAVEPRQIVAIGITNQRETTVVWDRATGKPLAPAIVWQCRRTADYCNELRSSPAAAKITRKTGLVIDAYFSGSKVKWILDHVPDARARARNGEALFGNIDTWLMWQLTGGKLHATDFSNACRRRDRPGRRDTDRRNRRGSAGSPRRSGLLPSRLIEEHLRNRLFRADAHRIAPAGVEESTAGDARRLG
jgi:hypothetical protein